MGRARAAQGRPQAHASHAHLDFEGLVPGRFFHFNCWTEVRVRCSIVDENINRFSFPVKFFKEGIYLRKISVMTGPYRCLETFLIYFLQENKTRVLHVLGEGKDMKKVVTLRNIAKGVMQKLLSAILSEMRSHGQ